MGCRQPGRHDVLVMCEYCTLESRPQVSDAQVVVQAEWPSERGAPPTGP